jgi:RNA polymerase-interacting CarD/CdnL/TRCF family regulator
MFKLKEKVFYPHPGAGEIREVVDKEILGEKGCITSSISR